MRKVNVEIAEDASRSEGGYAVVLLHGVSSLPDGVRFRVKPVDVRDSSENEAAQSWPKGEQRPVAIRSTEFGVELVIGPEIVECPALLPGTVGVIEIAQAGVRGEFLWPSIRPTARPRRRHLSLVKPQRAAAGVGSGVLTSTPPAAADESPAARLPSTEVAPAAVAAAMVEDAPLIVVSLSPEPGGTLPLLADPMQSGQRLPSAEQLLAAAQHRLEAQTTPPPLPLLEDLPPAGEASGPGAPLPSDMPTGATAGERIVSLPAPMPVTAPRRVTARYAAIAAALVLAVLGGNYLLAGAGTQRTEAAARDAQPELAIATRTGPEPAAPQPVAPTAEPAVRPVSPADDQTRREEMQRATARQQVASIPPAAEPASIPPPAPAEPTARPVAAESPAVVSDSSAETEVTLSMRGGGFQVTGLLRGYDGTKYVIDTRTSGTMTMDASRFECQGPACARPAAAILAPAERPNPLRPDSYVIEGSMALGAGFVPELIKAYANSVGATAAPVSGGSEKSAKYRISDTRGMELATIAIEAQPSATALAALEQGTAAIALIERPVGLDDDQRSASSGRRPGAWVEHQIGMDGIAAVVSPRRDMRSISLETLAKLVSGQVSDWVELGMAPGPVQLYLPHEASGTAELFNRLVLRPRNLKPSPAVTQTRSDAEAAEAVARDQNGLALVSFAAAKGVRALNIEMQCGLIARPTPFGVKTEEYPLARRLYLVAPAQPGQPSARGLLRVVQSPEIAAAITAGGLIDNSPATVALAEQSERMAWAINAPATSFDMGEMRQMLADFAGMSRVSLTLRFNAANELDARSKRDIARLASALKEPDFAGKRVLLAGFTDLGGRFQQNMTLGLKRAGQVRAALLTAAGPGLDQRLVTAKGYGPLAPVGCGNGNDGQRLNRRVEVWVANDATPRSAAR